MRKIVLLLGLLICSLQIKSQFANNWMIGNGYGLNFNTTIPTVTTSALSGHPDNSSTISDAAGNLLFYTNGYTVWNKNHVIMPNGSGLIGSYSGGQCALIVPIPCNPKKYVIFHVTMYASPGNLSYSVVDMNLNSGLGDVVSSQKNVSLGSGWTEKICAYYNASTNSFWVLAHKWVSDQFVAFKVDASSIATTSVVSSIGSIHSCGSFGGVHDAMGQLTISPDGTKILNALTCQDKFEIFDFNASTGVLSNSIAIPGNTGNAWGTAFSPDSKKIYVTSIFGSNVYQYDISVYNSSSILSSITSVYNTFTGGYSFGYMELGPNGKIYIPRPNTNFLSTIDSPNSLGTACNFLYNGVSITGGGIAQWGLSRVAYNIPTSYSISTFSLNTITSSVQCNGMSSGSATVTPVSAGAYNYLWSPGNYTTSSTSGLSAGNYTVTVSDGSCASTTSVVSITEPQPITIAFDPLTICAGYSGPINPVVTGGTSVYTYSWSTGAMSTGILVSPTITTTYTLYITDGNGCMNSSAATVTVSNCTSILKHEAEIELSVYPNPFEDRIYINSKRDFDEVLITDMAGKIILSVKPDIKYIDTKNLAIGVYFLTIEKDNKSLGSRRIIKID